MLNPQIFICVGTYIILRLVKIHDYTDYSDIYCFISKLLFLHVFDVFNKIKYDLLPVKGLRRLWGN